MPQRLSFQLYSARNFQPWEEVVAHLAACGYQDVEGFGDPAIYGEAVKFRALLDRYSLAMPTGHVFPLQNFESDLGSVVRFARTLGMHTLYCPYILPEEQPKSGAGWKAWGKRLGAVARSLRDEGLGFGWHNHDFEFVKLKDGSFPIERIFEGGPLLDWECDIAWVAFARQNPLKWFKTYAERITAVHVKDNAPRGENLDQHGQADVGAGTLDWQPIFAALKNTRCRHYVIEHDDPRDFRSFARNSFNFASRT